LDNSSDTEDHSKDVDSTEDEVNDVINANSIKMASTSTQPPDWKPLIAKHRRVLGTLMEKSKTTPDAYPMTFTGLCTGCNQKSNRSPITNYTSEQVESIVDEMRSLGALTIVQGLGRVTKVRHYAYNWLGISKVEAAIMTELLLRGEQTMGDLRTRASRMEPIHDLNHLTELFRELKRRNLVVELSPPGRGQIVSHNLYPEWELEQLRKTVTSGIIASSDNDVSDESRTANVKSSGSDGNLSNVDSANRIAALECELVSVRSTVANLSVRLERLEKDLGVV
jgi:uncharacterized protein